ncbi:uncharacterized protein EAF02_003007 [Botrytis sinoallii]|uniref:uncharacterized protein n=1 Tax=Botrytis sinoallii TaxID=1463999 RepID=UPI001901A488|nr:uncharacterized protein EAF02_003007 [Botrytis sinoallii]KAF7888466.1 hypothetical protein EAF02_003007 [Botrytis sinoallii]
MRDGVNAPFDVVLQYLKPCKFNDYGPERMMETWYSKAGRIERHDRTEIAYTFFRPGIDDHAASEFMKIEQQQGDVPM